MFRMNVKQIIKLMAKSTDKKTIMDCENQLSLMFAVPVLIFGGITNFYGRLFYYGEPVLRVVIDSFFLLLVALLFVVVNRHVNKPKKQADIFTLLFVAVFVFIITRVYHIVGPASWTIAFVLVTISMLHIRRHMLIVITLTVGLTAVYAGVADLSYTLDFNYFITQTVSFSVMFIIAGAVHSILQTRFDKVMEQFDLLHESEEFLRQTLVSVGDGVITVNRDGMIGFLNPVASDLTGWSEREAKSKHLKDVFVISSADMNDRSDGIVTIAIELNKTFELSEDCLLIGKDGTERYIEISVAPIKKTEDEIIGAVLVFRDVSKKNEARKQVEYMSYHDQLTDLYNRRFFEEELMRLDTERQLPIAIIYGDVNGLKTVNDAFGHHKGDQLIKKVADILRAQFRAGELIARIGGDEFVVLLPKTDQEMTEKMVARVQGIIDLERFMELPLSVSFGVATKNDCTEALFDVMKKAEDAMYDDKRAIGSGKRSTDIASIMEVLWEKYPSEKVHSENVGKLSATIGKAMGLEASAIEAITSAGRFHDIGMITVEPTLLNKKGALSEDEWQRIAKHPESGYRLMSTSEDYLEAADYVRAHHENWDGTGYPFGLKGEEIELGSRIIRVAGAYDTMVTGKPYHKPIDKKRAINELHALSGNHYDPEVVRVFIEEVLTNNYGEI